MPDTRPDPGDAALVAVFRYGDWRNATLHMTDDQREAAASAVERAGETSPMVRWWDHAPGRASDGLTASQRFCAAVGIEHPDPLSPEEQAEWDAEQDRVDREVEAFYANPDRTSGPLVLRPRHPRTPTDT
jgi:hypothetical protein